MTTKIVALVIEVEYDVEKANELGIEAEHFVKTIQTIANGASKIAEEGLTFRGRILTDTEILQLRGD